MDPAVLAGALPGGEQMEQTGENQYRAVMNVKVGPVQGRFEGKILLEDILTPESYLMKVDGQGAPGFLAGEGRLALEEADGGGTTLRYAGDVTVGGRIAGVGQRLIESTAKSITRQGLQALDQTIAPEWLQCRPCKRKWLWSRRSRRACGCCRRRSGINPVKAPAPRVCVVRWQRHQPRQARYLDEHTRRRGRGRRSFDDERRRAGGQRCSQGFCGRLHPGR